MFTTLTTEVALPARPEEGHRVAPWWLGYLFLLSLRRLWEHPRRLLNPWISSGDRVLELGCGMGFFTLDLVRLVGTTGRIHAVDVQPRVLANLERRARRAGLADRIRARVGRPDEPGVDDLQDRIDVVHAHHVLHEVTDQERMVGRLAAVLRRGGLFYLAEPVGHVSPRTFAWECRLLGEAGLRLEARPTAPRQMIAVFRKP